jgi:hypothetical protein
VAGFLTARGAVSLGRTAVGRRRGHAG